MKGWEMYHSTWILLALKSDLDFFFFPAKVLATAFWRGKEVKKKKKENKNSEMP